MKKLFVCLLLVVALGGRLAAEELGLEAGVELGFGNVADKAVISVAPLLTFSKTFDALEVNLKAQYTVKFDDPDTVQSFYLEPEFIYTIPAGPGSLALGLYGENTFPVDPSGDMEGMIEPSVKYGQEFSFGELFVKVGLPYTFSPNTSTDLYGTLGYGRAGVGVEFTALYNLDPQGESKGYELLISYTKDAFYGELKVATDKKVKVYTVSPYAEIYLSKIKLWAGADFGNLGDSGQDVSVTPYLGVGYKF